MVFITFEDTQALYETVMFPREYRRFAPITLCDGPFVVIGQVTEEFGALTVTVKDLRLLAPATGGRNVARRPPMTCAD